MEIWSRERARPATGPAQPRAWGRLVRPALLLLLAGAAFALGGLAQQRGFFGRTVRPLLETNVALVPNWVAGLTAPAERVEIDIKQVHLDTLRADRSRALRAGVLMNPQEVPAQIRWRGRTERVSLRLKGDWVQGQLDSPKWSFRIKVKGDGRLFGMREFSLHHPGARNYLYEWVYHRALARADVIALRYQFVLVSLNGKGLGVYALEEHFDHLLIEANRRREGPILRFNEEALWADRGAHGRQWEASPTGLQSWFSSTIDAFNLNRLQSDPTLYREFLAARVRLEAFRRGELPTHQVFDVERLGRFFAISELLGATHGAGIWHNMRFYFNPVSGRLEPIGFDGDAGNEIEGVLLDPRVWEEGADEFHARLFADRTFVIAYVRALEQVSADGYLEQLLDDLGPEMGRALRVLYREWPTYRFDRDAFVHNRRVLRSVLHPARLVEAAGGPATPGFELRLASVQVMPVEVLGLAGGDSVSGARFDGVVLPGKTPGLTAERTLLVPASAIPAPSAPGDLAVRCRIVGTSAVREEPVRPLAPEGVECIWKEFGRGEGPPAAHPMLAVDRARRTVALRPGRWTLRAPLVIPRGYTVLAGPGTELDLRGDAMLISFSPLRWMGTEQAPVVVASDDRTGQGLVVLGARDTSVLSQVVFRGLASPGRDSCGLTGGVTFYESHVELAHVSFVGSQAEDALNLVRSSFRVADTSFLGSSSDALDVDFGTGTLTRVSFADCGNDALDISGSTVEVRDLVVDGAGDKGLSAGEQSRLTVAGGSIRDAEIGAASKDGSELRVSGLRMERCSLGFTVFRKKPEYGPATMVVQGVETAALKTLYLLESGSRLTMDGEDLEPNEDRVRGLLYGVKYGRASR